MGTKLKDLVIKQPITIDELKNKTLVVDSFNVLYQFLTTIRMGDGSPLRDSAGNITSHLNGLFYRTTNLMNRGLRLAFVFDGKPPALKAQEREKRNQAKIEAQKKYEHAAAEENIEDMKKYGARTARLTSEMVAEAKKLIEALGLPVIQAPSEGEAQAAFIVAQGDAFAEVSQDYDCVVFGVPRLVRNLTVSEKRKLPSKLAYQTVAPELITLKDNLKSWGISQDQLIALAMLVGTDFNPGGIHGIGPKNALKLVKKHDTHFDALFKEVKWSDHFDTDWHEIFDTFKHIPTTTDYALSWKPINTEKVVELLCEAHDFSKQRIEEHLAKLSEAQKGKKQKGLGDFF
ncbi:MAG: flap endonuclease-1 [Candidatus Woesearchaeota archaeon]|nr:flap endonuclease-1 [Candidatus Woesearchaeota archaeon]